MRSGSPTASSDRSCAASTFAASARASSALAYDHRRQRSIRAIRATISRSTLWRPGLLHGPARARVPDELGVAERWPAAVGVRRRRLAVERDTAAADSTSLTFCSADRPERPASADQRRPATPAAASIQRRCRDWIRRCRSRRRRLQGILPWQFAEAAPVDRHRRQLDFALRAAPARYRQGAAQAKGRRHQTLQLQRRDPILMKTLLISAARRGCRPRSGCCSRAGHSRRCHRGRRPRTGHQRVQRLQDGARRLCAARRPRCRTASRRWRRRSQTEQKSIQTAIDALKGKEPDAALQARVTGVPDQAAAGRSRSSPRSEQQIQRNQAVHPAADRDKLGPIYQQVMQRRGANVMVETGTTLATSTARRRHQRRARGAERGAADRSRRQLRLSSAAAGAAAGPLSAMNDQPASAAIGPLDIRRVMAALPHRYPMLLVDRVESLDPDKGDRRDQGGDDQRGLLPGPFPGPADHARRADRRGAGAGRGRARGREPRPRRTRASSSISWRSKARSSGSRSNPACCSGSKSSSSRSARASASSPAGPASTASSPPKRTSPR